MNSHIVMTYDSFRSWNCDESCRIRAWVMSHTCMSPWWDCHARVYVCVCVCVCVCVDAAPATHECSHWCVWMNCVISMTMHEMWHGPRTSSWVVCHRYVIYDISMTTMHEMWHGPRTSSWVVCHRYVIYDDAWDLTSMNETCHMYMHTYHWESMLHVPRTGSWAACHRYVIYIESFASVHANEARHNDESWHWWEGMLHVPRTSSWAAWTRHVIMMSHVTVAKGCRSCHARVFTRHTQRWHVTRVHELVRGPHVICMSRTSVCMSYTTLTCHTSHIVKRRDAACATNQFVGRMS